MSTLYNVFLACHLLAMVAWFAGLFYLPRLFVYHVEHPAAAPTLKLMEKNLMSRIMRPAAVATILFALGMIVIAPTTLQMGWLHAKLFFVFLVIAYHGTLEGHLARFQRGTNTKSGKFFRLYNEVPTLLLIAIVFLAVLKPF